MNDKMDEWKIPLYKVYTDDEDVELITKIVKRGTYWAMGPEIEEFENAIKNYVGSDYCLTLNSGTSALHALLLAYGIKDGDEIIMPSFSFISTANSALFVNAKPVFTDIENTTFGLDPESIKKNISSKTKAIMPVDFAGLSCNIFEIKEIAERNHLILIEDAAEGLGSIVHDKKVGSISDSSIFSFCGNKVLTTGEGGAMVTNSKEIYEKIKSIRSHGRLDKKSYFDDPSKPDYSQLGFNWRMSSITATLGLTQLSKLDKNISKRRENAKYISSHLSKHENIQVPSEPAGYTHIYQMYSIVLSDNKLRNDLQKHLLNDRIFSKVYFDPIHLTDFYKKKLNRVISLPVTENISERILTLPMYPNMTKEEKEYLLNSIDNFFEMR
jgi:perosamine synthetase